MSNLMGRIDTRSTVHTGGHRKTENRPKQVVAQCLQTMRLGSRQQSAMECSSSAGFL